jgi:hypothetical protein
VSFQKGKMTAMFPESSHMVGWCKTKADTGEITPSLGVDKMVYKTEINIVWLRIFSAIVPLLEIALFSSKY